MVIPPGVKHWHGAAADSWFTHLAVEVPGEHTESQWLEPVDEATADELLSLAASYDVPVVMMNRSATPAQLAAYDKV